MVVILMGAAGAGKTTVGRALALELGWPFVDGDHHHPAANIQKMARGEGLTDADREGWLQRLRADVERAISRREHLVMACSALKARYRDTLAGGLAPVRFVYLRADPALLRERIARRAGHFTTPAIVTTQMHDLEEPAAALVLDAALDPSTLIRHIRHEFGL